MSAGESLIGQTRDEGRHPWLDGNMAEGEDHAALPLLDDVERIPANHMSTKDDDDERRYRCCNRNMYPNDARVPNLLIG